MTDARSAWLLTPAEPVAYDRANNAMHTLATRRLNDEIPDTVIILQHPPVFTAGRRAKDDELLWDTRSIESMGGLVRKIDRGGSFTFHGPGQLVCYPILGLGTSPDATRYLRQLEEVVIRACADVGAVVTRRDDVQTGVWSGEEKVCAIGIRLLRARVSLHGFALNCDTDLSWFEGIVACGLPEHGVTSLSRLLGHDVSVDVMRPRVVAALTEVVDLSFEPAPAHVAEVFSPAAATV